jgi:hypothetical protein
MERRTLASRRYEPTLPDYFPVALAGASIAVDFVVGRGDGRGPIDARVSPRQALSWLRSMPSYRVGVPVLLGHAGDAGLAVEKNAELAALVDPHRAVTWRTALPLEGRARALFARPPHNLTLELVATPRAPGAPGPDPLPLARSAEGLDPRRAFWRVGPVAAAALAEAAAVIDALPRGSRLSLRAADGPGAPPALDLGDLEARAHGRGLTVTDWPCRESLAPLGRGLVEVDRLTGQPDLGRRALDLVTCAGCPSRRLCHGAVDRARLEARLLSELEVTGLSAAGPPGWTGPRSLSLPVAEPAARGDEVFLSHALGVPVSVTLSRGGRPVAGDAAPEPAVLRRWWRTGFLPVTQLNAAADHALEDLDRRRLHLAQPPAACAPGLAAAI